MAVVYRSDMRVPADQYIDMLRRSALAERRPTTTRESAMRAMIVRGPLGPTTPWADSRPVRFA